MDLIQCNKLRFPKTNKQFSDTSKLGVQHESVTIYSSSIRCHNKGFSLPRAPTPFNSVVSYKPKLLPVFLTDCRSEVPRTSCSGTTNLLEHLTLSKEPVYSLDLDLWQRICTAGTELENMHGSRYRESVPSPGIQFSPNLHEYTNPQALWSPFPITQHDWLAPWQLTQPQVLRFPQWSRWNWKFQSSNHMVGPSGNQTYPQVFSQFYFH